MTANRLTSLGLAALVAAAGCGKSRGTGTDLGTVTLPGGAADGSDVTVEAALCSRCHGDPARAPITGDAAGVAFAPPIDVSGETTGSKVGAHLAHLRAGAFRDEGFLCSTCHVIPQNAGAHTPGVTLRGRAATSLSGTPIAPTWAAGACTSTYCHGNFPGGVGSVTVDWMGAPLACGTSCHQTPPPNPTHSGYAFPATCPTCHSGTVDGTGKIKVSGGLHVNGVFDGGCTNCHGTPGRANGGIAGAAYDRNQAAAPPAPTTGYAASTVVIGAHAAHSNPVPSVAGASQPTGGVYKPIACTECHPDDTTGGHPNGSLTVTFVAATGADLAAYPASLAQGNGMTTPTTCNTYCHDAKAGGSVATWSWTGTGANCGSCHGFPPASHTGVSAAATACNGCHDGTVKADGTIDIAGGKHINGNVEGGESTGGAACGGCHATIFAGMSNAAKASRHALGNVAGTNDSATDSGISWNAPLSANAAAARSCVNMCHDDHPHVVGGSADHSYNAYADANQRANTPTAATRAKTDFSAAATNGGLCVSCHRFASAATGAFDKAAFDASAHDFTARAGTTWQYALHLGTFDRNCTKCHASFAEGNTPAAPATASGAAAVHFGDNASLLAGKVNPAGSPATFVCYNCHGAAATPAAGAQGNRSGKDVATQIGKLRAHPVNADAVHDTSLEAAGSYNDGKLSGANRHANCADCHDPHRAANAIHAYATTATSARNQIAATSPLQGAPGVTFVYAGLGRWATTGSGNFSLNPVTAAKEYEICFRCHSSFAWGTTPPNGLSPNGSATTPAETDVAREFNPANRSGHPIVTGLNAYTGNAAPKALLTSQMKAPWNVNVGTQTMMCSDCHNTDAAAPAVQGPHGSAAQFMLRGPNQANWPHVSYANWATSWCANCHNAGSNPGHANGNHGGYFCDTCHVVIPHGSNVSRLLADHARMPSRYAYNNTLLANGLQGFTKAADTGYTKPNCAASCSTGDHPVPGTTVERWNN